VKKNPLIEARMRAEEAVRDMPDGELKVKAFETLLKHVLSDAVSIREKAEPTPKVRPTRVDTAGAPPKSCAERILSLKDDGFFKSQRSIAEIRTELKKNGWHYPVTSLSGPLQSLIRNRKLRREDVQGGEARKGWKYSDP